MKNFVTVAGLLFSLAACSASSPRDSFIPDTQSDAGSEGVAADSVEIVAGVPDRGRDPAVVAIDIGGEGLCTGTLIDTDVVLTARHCVSRTSEQVQCPGTSAQITSDRAASTLAIYVGDDIAHAELVARGKQLIVPKGNMLCGDDMALIVLDREVAGITPLDVRKTALASGDHVRAVGYGKRGDSEPAGTKLLREHVKVLDVSRTEFEVGEATCQGDSGGPAIDESSGEVVGVVSRGGPACEGSDVHNIYTRTDAFLALIAQAKALGGTSDDADAGKSKGHKPPKPTSDIGAACTKSTDCPSGVCVSSNGKQYCSQTCGSGDRCPNHYHCGKASSGTSVCVQQL